MQTPPASMTNYSILVWSPPCTMLQTIRNVGAEVAVVPNIDVGCNCELQENVATPLSKQWSEEEEKKEEWKKEKVYANSKLAPPKVLPKVLPKLYLQEKEVRFCIFHCHLN